MISKADHNWLTANPPQELYILRSVAKREDLPDTANPWDARWVDELFDVFVFAFGRWLPFAEVVAKEHEILDDDPALARFRATE